MLEKLEVQIRYKCTECKGTGVYQNPAWEEFYSAFPPGKKQPDDRETQEWFSEHGYTPYYWEIPEEIECDSCAGSGTYQKWVPISELIECYSIEDFENAIEYEQRGQNRVTIIKLLNRALRQKKLGAKRI